MKNRGKGKRLVSLMLSLMIAASLICIGASGVMAESGFHLGGGIGKTMWIGQGKVEVVVTDGSNLYTKNKSVKSSNSKVLKVYRNQKTQDEDSDIGTGDYIKPIKAGTATVTVVCTDGKKKHTVKQKIKVKKYPNQIKTLKVNGKTVKLTGKKRFAYNTTVSSDKASIKLTLKKGWKVSKVFFWVTGDNGIKMISNTVKKNLKSGNSFSFPKSKWDELHGSITMKNSSGETIIYEIDMHR